MMREMQTAKMSFIVKKITSNIFSKALTAYYFAGV